jgi:hypothetical protein
MVLGGQRPTREPTDQVVEELAKLLRGDARWLRIVADPNFR